MNEIAAIRTYQRTLDAKPNETSIVKPGELVDVIELVPLTLTDRRIYNLLLANAWDQIGEARVHEIPKRDLMQTEHKGTDRIGDSIERLMSAVVRLRVQRGGKWETTRVNLLGPNTEPDSPDGSIRYVFDEQLRGIIQESTVFARLHRQIMFALTSKYSLALYEMIQKRGNLLSKTSETFPVESLRGYLGVPEGKLSSWINFRNKALDPAVAEVSNLSDFAIRFETTKGTEKGKTKQIAAVTLFWSRKTDDALNGVQRELDNTRVGRKSRLAGTVETVTFDVAPSGAPVRVSHIPLRTDTIEKAKKLMRGYDIYRVEEEWRDWMAKSNKPRPDKPDGAFINFCKIYKQNNPL